MTKALVCLTIPLLLAVSACGGDASSTPSPEPDATTTRAVETTSAATETEPIVSKKAKPKRERERKNERSSLADEAARQACLAYDRAVLRLNAGGLDDDQLVIELQAVAANALVAEDPMLEAAADSMFSAAQEKDRRALEHAARVFVSECKRLVPEHRLVVPTL